MWDLRLNKIVYTFWEHTNAHSFASSIIDKCNVLLAASTLSNHVIQLPDKSNVNDVTSLHQVYYTEVIILFSSVVVACNLWWVW